MNIELRNVSIGYSAEKPVASEISEIFRPGGFTVISGPSGSGKSSLLKTLNRLIDPLDGEIFMDGEPLGACPVTRMRRNIAYIQQLPVLIEGSVRENLLLPFSFGLYRDEKLPDDNEIEKHLEGFLLNGVRPEDAAAALSVGQKQRLCIIRALLTKPRYLLLDEPTSALDTESKDIVERCIEEYNRETGAGIVIITHQRFEPAGMRARFLKLGGGRLSKDENFRS